MRYKGINNLCFVVVKNRFLASLLFKKAFGLALILLLTLLPLLNVEAAPNYQINYQGKLHDSAGDPVTNGDYDITFNLYTASSGGSPIWTEAHTGGANDITVTDGLFSVMLGSLTSLSTVNFNQTLYLGVTVESDSEMTPRKILGTVPSAFEADKLDGLTSADFISTSTTALPNVWSASGLGSVGSSTATTTFLGNLAAAGSSIFNGILTVFDRVTSPYFMATSTSVASQFPYASTTMISATTASTTNLIISGLGSGLTKVTNGVVSLATAGTDYLTSAFQNWQISGGYLTPTTTQTVLLNGGFVSSASSTVSGLLKTDYASTTALTISGTAYIGSLNGPLQANGGTVSATSTIGVRYGGTGLTTDPTYGLIPVGNGTGYTLTATSSLGLAFSDITGVLGIANGGTNASALNSTQLLYNDGTRIAGTSTPTASYFIATSTSNASVFPYASTTSLTVSGRAYLTTEALVANKLTLGGSGISVTSSNNITIQGGLQTSTSGADINLIGLNSMIPISGTTQRVLVTGTFAPTSGTGVHSIFEVQGAVNQTGGANGITRGVYINPTITSAADFRSLEVARGNSIFLGNVGIGTTTPGALLSASSSDTNIGLMVDQRGTNDILRLLDAGTNVFTVRDGGNVGLGTTTPGSLLSLGNTGASTINITPTGTSTFGLGIDLRGGCYAINGTCIGGGSASLSGGTAGMLAAWTSSSALTATGTPNFDAFNATSTTATSTIAGGLAIETSGFVYDYSTNRVGIGTASPGVPLEVVGNIRTTGDGVGLIVSDTSLNYSSNFVYSSSLLGLSNISRIRLGGNTGTSAFAISNYDAAINFIVNRTGNVGVGTTSPYARLSVAGETVAERFTATSTSQASVFPYASTTALTVSGHTFSGGLIIDDVTGGGIALRDAGSASLTPTQNQITWAHPSAGEDTNIGYLDASNFVINVRSGGTRQLNFTNSSTGGLNVLVSEGLLAVGTTTVGAGISASSTTQVGLMVDQRGTDDILRLLDAGTNVFTVKDGGNVGVGTSSPQAKLAIGAGNILLDNNQYLTAYKNGGAVVNLIGINTSSQTQIDSGSGNNMIFRPSGSTAMTLSSAGLVGIGTTSPDYLLTLGDGGGSANNKIAIDSAAARQSSIAFRSAGVNRWHIGRGDSDVLSDSTFFIGSDSGNANDPGGNGARFVINSSGLIGMGTVSPDENLHISGNSTTEDTVLVLGNQAFTGGMLTTLKWQADTDGASERDTAAIKAEQTAGTTGKLRFFTDNGGIKEGAVLTDLAFWGIGTTTPGAQLAASSSATSIGLMIDQRGTGDIARFLDAGTPVLTIRDGGLVGIGTSTSATTEGLLHIAENSTGAVNSVISNTNSGTGAFATFQLRNGGSLSESLRLGVLGTGFTTSGGFIQDAGFIAAETNLSGGLTIMTRAAAPIAFYTNGSTNERMRITSSGLVGIGTTTPGAQLSASTTSEIGLMVNQSGTPDILRLLDNGSTVFRVADGGEVTLGPGTSNPGIQLQEAGTMRWTVYNDNTNDRFYITDDDGDNGVYIAQDATSWTANSDIRLKENIVPIEGALEKILSLTGYTYNFKGTQRKEIGLIAQEVEPLFPQLVDTNGTYLGLTYDRLGPILIQAIKEQQEQIDSLSDFDLDNASSTATWTLDEDTGRIKYFTSLDLNNQELINVKSILSASGNWSISEDGTLTAKKIQTDELCVGVICVGEDRLRELLENAGIDIDESGGDVEGGGDNNGGDDNATTTPPTDEPGDDNASSTPPVEEEDPPAEPEPELETPSGDEIPTDNGGTPAEEPPAEAPPAE